MRGETLVGGSIDTQARFESMRRHSLHNRQIFQRHRDLDMRYKRQVQRLERETKVIASRLNRITSEFQGRRKALEEAEDKLLGHHVLLPPLNHSAPSPEQSKGGKEGGGKVAPWRRVEVVSLRQVRPLRPIRDKGDERDERDGGDGSKLPTDGDAIKAVTFMNTDTGADTTNGKEKKNESMREEKTKVPENKTTNRTLPPISPSTQSSDGPVGKRSGKPLAQIPIFKTTPADDVIDRKPRGEGIPSLSVLRQVLDDKTDPGSDDTKEKRKGRGAEHSRTKDSVNKSVNDVASHREGKDISNTDTSQTASIISDMALSDSHLVVGHPSQYDQYSRQRKVKRKAKARHDVTQTSVPTVHKRRKPVLLFRIEKCDGVSTYISKVKKPSELERKFFSC